MRVWTGIPTIRPLNKDQSASLMPCLWNERIIKCEWECRKWNGIFKRWIGWCCAAERGMTGCGDLCMLLSSCWYIFRLFYHITLRRLFVTLPVLKPFWWLQNIIRKQWEDDDSDTAKDEPAKKECNKALTFKPYQIEAPFLWAMISR